MALLMLDNFTYTVFSFGIATTQGIGRGLYGLVFLLLFVWSLWQVWGSAARLQSWLLQRKRSVWVWAVMGIWLAFSLILAAPDRNGQNLPDTPTASAGESPTIRPHIILITADGLSAAHMSLYGYERETTPYLSSLAESSLVAENVFPNAANTLGSLASMFTGKPALETRVLYSPDILRGEHAYQHLPGILRANGYYTVQYGFRFYVDAYVVNLLDGFDVANGRSLSYSTLQAQLHQKLPEEVAYFIAEIGNRIADRLRHIYYLKPMQNPREALAAEVPLLDDENRMVEFINSLDEFDQPRFVHLHYLGTHGGKFQPKQQVFSLGKDPATQAEWDDDFYDDSILEFDASVKRIVTALKQQGLLSNTLLIISSDHAEGFEQRQRIPLLMRFPGGSITGRISLNVQSLDIAPTILDYLGLTQPEWMIGHSLLDADLGQRYIYAVSADRTLAQRGEDNNWTISPERMQPPFYQVGEVSIVDCQRWYELSLVNMTLTSSDAIGHTAPCPEKELITYEQAFDLLLAYLRNYGYDVSSLEAVPLDTLTIWR